MIFFVLELMHFQYNTYMHCGIIFTILFIYFVAVFWSTKKPKQGNVGIFKCLVCGWNN